MAGLKELTKKVTKLFRDWGVKKVPSKAVAKALRDQNEEELFRLLGIREEALAALLEMLVPAFVDAGKVQIAKAPKGLVGHVGFGMSNPSLQEYLRNKSSTLIQDITTEQRDIVRSVMGDVAQGRQNPLIAVKELVGTRGPTGERHGSVIGLSWNQYAYVKNMRKELSDPAKMGSYFQRIQRNRIYDRTVKKAMEEQRPLPPDQIDKLANAYTERLIRWRASAIARTEYKQATEAGRIASVKQMIANGDVAEQDVWLVWDSTGDSKVRFRHKLRNEMRTRVGEPFRTPEGYLMEYPGDSSLGAPASEVVNCRCITRVDIDYAAALFRRGNA